MTDMDSPQSAQSDWGSTPQGDVSYNEWFETTAWARPVIDSARFSASFGNKLAVLDKDCNGPLIAYGPAHECGGYLSASLLAT